MKLKVHLHACSSSTRALKAKCGAVSVQATKIRASDDNMGLTTSSLINTNKEDSINKTGQKNQKKKSIWSL